MKYTLDVELDDYDIRDRKQHVINAIAIHSAGLVHPTAGKTTFLEDAEGNIVGQWTCGPMKRTCQVPADHHSDDILDVWHGRSEPTHLCGFHESRGLAWCLDQMKGEDK